MAAMKPMRDCTAVASASSWTGSRACAQVGWVHGKGLRVKPRANVRGEAKRWRSLFWLKQWAAEVSVAAAVAAAGATAATADTQQQPRHYE